MSTQADRIVSLLSKQSAHPLRNAILFVFGWVFLVLLSVVCIIIIVFPRTQGYITLTTHDSVMSNSIKSTDLLMFKKLRQSGAQDLNPGDIIAYQPDSKRPEYTIGRVDEVIGTEKDTEFTVNFDSPTAGDSQTVTLDMVRGVLVYQIPMLGIGYGLLNSAEQSFLLILVAQLLLVYAGWQIGTSMINARDPKRQARAARLRTAALAGNLETTRRRLRNQH